LIYIPPLSIPDTAASETLRSTAFAASAAVSVMDFLCAIEVEKRRLDGRTADRITGVVL
jgi:hypothetical protein